MGKFKVGDRVSFLYFDKKLKGTLVDQSALTRSVWRLRADFSRGVEHTVLYVAEHAMKKLKPKKPRRECWVVYGKQTKQIIGAYDTESKANCWLGAEFSYVVHMREVRK